MLKIMKYFDVSFYLAGDAIIPVKAKNESDAELVAEKYLNKLPRDRIMDMLMDVFDEYGIEIGEVEESDD